MSITDEMMEKAKSAGTIDEVAALAADDGVELSDATLEGVAGGVSYISDPRAGCPSKKDDPNNC